MLINIKKKFTNKIAAQPTDETNAHSKRYITF
jgi:hypothetical protein